MLSFPLDLMRNMDDPPATTTYPATSWAKLQQKTVKWIWSPDKIFLKPNLNKDSIFRFLGCEQKCSLLLE